MKNLTIRDARKALTHLDRLLDEEGEIAISRRGEIIAHVVQVKRKLPIPSHRDLRQGIPLMRKGSETIIRKERNGR